MSRRLFPALLALALLGAIFCSAASAARFYTPDYGSKTPEEIGGFDLGADGSLTPIPGSPFAAEEPGLGGLQGLAFTPDGTRAISGLLFTGGVQAYSVPPSGIFQLAGATKTASVTSVAITPDGRFAYVATREFKSMAEGIRRFAVGADGSLTSLGPPTSAEEYNDVAITSDGRFLFATKANAIERFAVGGDGSLASLGTTPAPGAYLLSTSADERFLFVFSASGGDPGVSTFAVAGDGNLAQVGSAASLGSTASAGLFAVAPDGRFAFVPDYNNDLIRTVAIGPDGAPSLRGGGMPVEDPESLGVSPDGRYLVFYRAGSAGNALEVAAIGADGSLAKLPFSTPWNTGEPERIVFQPQPPPTARFTFEPAAPGKVTRFDARGSTGAARFEWDFGDGTKLADGGPAPAHVYPAPGDYAVKLTVVDASGCSVRRVYTGQSTLCPGGNSPAALARLDTPPALGAVRAVPRKFVPKVKGAKAGKAKRGTKFRYSLSEPAMVRFKFERKLPGRLVGGSCKRRTPANAKRKRCSLFKTLGSRSQRARIGANKLKWNGKLKGKPLAAGSYRATAVATDEAGGRSTPETVGFRILPLPRQP